MPQNSILRQFLIILAVVLLGWCAFVLFALQTELNQPENILLFVPEDASEVLIIPDVASFKAHILAHEGTTALWPSDTIFSHVLALCLALDDEISVNSGKTSLAITRHQSDILSTLLLEKSDKSTADKIFALLKEKRFLDENKAFKLNNSLIAFSNNSALLGSNEETLLNSSPRFIEAYKKSGKNSDAIYLFKTDSAETWNNFDLVIHERHLLLNGFQQGSFANSKSISDSLDYQIPVMSGADSLRFFKGSWAQIQKDCINYWAEQNMEAERSQMLTEIEKSCNCSVQNAFEYWPKGNILSYQYAGSRVVSLGSHGSASAMEALSIVADTLNTENIYGNRLITLKTPLNLGLILGDKGKTIAEFALVGKFFTAFSKNKEALTRLAREIQANQILNSPPGALNPAEFLIKDAQWAAEGNGDYALNSQVIPGFTGIPVKWKSSRSISSSCATKTLNDSLLFVNLVVGLKGDFIEQNPENANGSVWELALDKDLLFGPALVTNHYTKEKELFVQDIANTIYLISSSGNILWKTAIDGPITSYVEQIDMFKNGKLQMIFGTEASVYCIDRNGRSLEGFPVRLKAKASSPVRVFDYDRDKNYRIIVGCEDGNIYNFNIEGKPTKGWKYSKSANPCSKIEHARFGNHDHLITLSGNGQVTLLKRDGTVRSEFKNELKLQPAGANFQMGSDIESSAWIVSDKEGNVHALMLDGNHSKLFSTSEAQLSIDLLPAPADSAPDFIIWNGARIKRINVKSEILWESDCTSRPVIQRNEQNIFIAYSDGNLLYIKTPDGQDIQNFPQIGSTSGYLGLLDKSLDFFSISNSGNKLICRKLVSGNP